MKNTMERHMVKSPYTIEPDMGIQEALDFMRECDIRHLPVTVDGQLKGLVSERDLQKSSGAPNRAKLLVGDIMQTDVFAVTRSSHLRDVIEEMKSGKLGSAVVVNTHREVIGIFTQIDALEILMDLLDDGEESETLKLDDFAERWSDLRFSEAF